MTGTYYYLLSGNLLAGNTPIPDAELGILVADGQGHVAGQSNVTTNGTLVTHSLSGTYVVQGTCRGTMTLTVDSSGSAIFSLEIVNGGESALIALSSPSGVLVGRAYQVSAGTPQCGNGSFTGSYGLQLSGVSGGLVFSEQGQVVSDGNGLLTLTGVQNSGGTVSLLPGIGGYSLGSNCSGTAFIGNQFGSAHYLFAVVQNGKTVLFLQTDAGKTISGTAQPESIGATILPDFVFGGGFYSAIYFTNTGNSAVSFPVNFIGDLGGPLSVPSVGGSSAIVNLSPQGTALIEAPDAGTLTQGYASLFLPRGVVSYGVFRKSAPGVPDQEVVVPLSDASSTRQTLIWDDTSFVTAVAIVNPSSVATVVTISVRDDAGNLIGSPTISLGAKAKKAVVMRDIPGLAGMAGKRGSADFSVIFGNVAVLGLRFSGSIFTSIPTVGR